MVQLAHMVDGREELLEEEEYNDLVEETRSEVAKYGQLLQVGGGGSRGSACVWLTAEVAKYGRLLQCVWRGKRAGRRGGGDQLGCCGRLYGQLLQMRGVGGGKGAGGGG